MTMRIMVGVFETPHVFPNRMAGGGLYADQERTATNIQILTSFLLSPAFVDNSVCNDEAVD